MAKNIFIGVDGGATKSKLRVEDERGHLLGQATGGPASVRISVDKAWQSIHAALMKVLQPLSISFADRDYRFHVGMGLAGCEVKEAYQAFLNTAHPFTTLVVSYDSHIACLGAHKGHDGAIIIAGTGVVGYQIQAGQTQKVGGWGFPHDDEGSGAWLGLYAVKETLQWLDGRLPPSSLAKTVYDYFAQDKERFISWANQANSTAFAEIAPLVIQQSEAQDPVAIRLLQQAAAAIDRVGETLELAQTEHSAPLPCSLVGSIATFLQPFLGVKLRARLCPCQLNPDSGAILLVRNHLSGKDIK